FPLRLHVTWPSRSTDVAWLFACLASLVAVILCAWFFGLLGYITVLSVHALDASAYQTGYNHLVANVEHILDQIGLPVNITTTLHGNVDKAAHTVVTETMDVLSVMTLIYLTYFLCTRTRASDAGGIWPRSTPISSGL
ncbi:hypothetical protein F441_07691, partial [Phytophthora nicotianae CJ01A1]